MSLVRTVNLRCDECGTKTQSDRYDRARELREDFRLDGWRRRGGKDYCPKHA